MITTMKAAFSLMGQGYRIRIPLHRDGPMPEAMELVDGLFQRTGESERPRFPLDPTIFVKLMNTHEIQKLTKGRNGQRVGWEEAGYDGDKADWYCMMQ